VYCILYCVSQKLNYENAQKLLPPELLLLAQMCTKSFVGWGFAPDPTGGAYSAPSDLQAGLGDGAPRVREGEREKEGVLECPDPELASLVSSQTVGLQTTIQLSYWCLLIVRNDNA